ncbi:fas-binding factor 1 homolog [Actinia tenebrosa]|uniref:Fas-binding factor 1 homolog n=1 Tax=Actinia tenebrosa TaxID=6105 RepID=A0A6P8IL29_ACTTE|nr:fas-binding factor 1 homolog [Actinia tenebrosa]
MKKSGDPFGRPATKGRSTPMSLGKSQASKTGRGSKLSTLTSSATDEDFYSSLADMAGDNFHDDDEEESMTELDAKNLADTLEGMDDLDSDLFGDSLRRKTSTKNVSNTKPTTTSTPSKNKLSNTATSEKQDKTETRDDTTRKTAEKRGSSSSPTGKKFSLNKYDNLDFDEDDPLAGLLSDDEDAATKSKAKKKTAAAKKTPVKKEPEPVAVSAELERPTTSRSQQRQESQSLDLQSPPLSPNTKTQNRQETASPKSVKFSDRISSPTESQDGSLAASPRPKGRQSQSKPKNDVSFDDDGDDLLPGIDQSPRQTPSSRQTSVGQTPSTRQTSGTPGRRREQKTDSDLFGEDDGLLGLDEGKPTAKQTNTKASRFDELLGGKKEKIEPKPQKPKTLDDFMSNISTSSGKKSTETQPKKALSSKEEEESFQFGSYTPSAAIGPGGPGSRPDTAPGRRSVRFADELGLDDDLLGGASRPSTAPPERKQATQGKGRRGMKDSGGSSFDEDSTQKEPHKKEATPGSDWLGLGSEDPGLELELPSYKPSTPSKTVPKKTKTEDAAAQQKPIQDSTGRRNRGQDSSDGDDFLKMLGITPDDKTPKSPLDGSPRRGRRWRDQSSQEEDPLDLSSSLTDEMKPSPVVHQKAQPTGSSDVPTRSDSPGRDQVLRDQKLETPKTTALPQHGLRDQSLEISRTSAIPEREQETSKPTPLIYQGMRDQIPDVTSKHALPLHKDVPSLHFQSNQHPSQTSISTPSSPYLQQGQLQLTNQMQVHSPQGQPTTQYHTPSNYIPQGSRLITGDKAQLESEMHEIMKRIHEMEGNTQRQQIDGAGYVAQLEAKVRRLEMEIDHLQTTLNSMKTRHHTEMANIDTSNKAHIKTLEESYQLRETRIKEETDLQVSHYKDRIRALEEEKSTMQAAHLRKVQSLESSRNIDLDRIKELHRKGVEEMRQEHEEEMAHLRKLKEQEVSAATSAHGHTKSLQSLMQQVLNSTKDVSDMRTQIETTHKSNISERELAAKARDEYLTHLQERLAKQQAENDEERARLQGLIAKMEVHMREQSRQVDQERWRLTQEDSRIKALQSALEDERRITMEQLAMERADVQRAREELLREQKRITTELQEERRNISMERARLSSAHREILTKEKHKTDTTIQAEAEMEITASKIKEDAAALGVRQAQLKQEEDALRREKRDFSLRLERFEEEKDRIGKLSLEVQRRSEEIGKLCTENTRAREEGEEALARAEMLRRETENERAELENRFILIQEKEKQLAQDRVSIAHERRVLEMDKRNGRCRQCEGNTTDSPLLIADLPDGRISSTPVISALDFDCLSQSPGRTLGTPDILLNSLELKRNLRKWTNEKEKDEEFLEQESQFLNQLRGSRGKTKKRLSVTS